MLVRSTEAPTPFARCLKLLLKARRMSGSELARRLHYSQSLVSQWLNGRQPSDEQLLQVAAVLDVSPAQLTGEAEPPAPPDLPEPEPVAPPPPAAPVFQSSPPPASGASTFEKQFWRRAAALAFAVRYQFYSPHPLRCPECAEAGVPVMLIPVIPTRPDEVDDDHLLFWVCPTVTCTYRTAGDLLNTEVFFRIANEFPGFGPHGV